MFDGGWKQSKAVAAVALVAIAGALIALCCRGSGGRHPPPESDLRLIDLGAMVFYVCDDCGHESAGSFRPTPYPCEQCRAEAVVESVRYRCTRCDRAFELCRRRAVMSRDGKRPVGFEIKEADGSWRRSDSLEPKCPFCDTTDAATLERLRPETLLPPPAPPDEADPGLAPR